MRSRLTRRTPAGDDKKLECRANVRSAEEQFKAAVTPLGRPGATAGPCAPPTQPPHVKYLNPFFRHQYREGIDS